MSKQETTPESPERLYTVQELVDAGILGDPVAGGRGRLLELLGDDVVLDVLGRECVTEKVAVRLAEERREEKARAAEEAARQREEAASKHRPPRGVPALSEDASAWESMISGPGYQTVADEFGRPKPTFLQDELAAGKRAQAEKQRLAQKAKDDLSGGKP